MNKLGLFGKTHKKLMWMSLGIMAFSLILFSMVVTTVFNAVVFEEVDNQIEQELTRMKINLGLEDYYFSNKKEINGILYRNLYGYSFNGSISIHPIQENIISTEAISNPKLLTLVYYDDQLIYRGNSLYFNHEELPQLSRHTNSNYLNFKQDGYNFRAKTISVDEISIQTIVNIDSEMTSIYSLYRVLVVSFILLMVINLALVQKLIRVVLKPVEKSYDSQKQFIQDVSHEIRTPLTVMKGQVERLMRKKEVLIASEQQTLAELMSEISGIERMQRDLLTLSKVDVDNGYMLSTVLLRNIVEEVREMYELIAEYEEKDFIIHNFNEELWITTDATKLKHCLTILLDNAFKYTHEKDSIEMMIENQSKFITISVVDTGIGIKEEDLSRIFDRFYRSSSESIQNIEGSGIGLAILKAYCDLLNYKIEVFSTIGEETTFKLIIPKK